MEISCFDFSSSSLGVETFEFLIFPASICQHCTSDISFQLHFFLSKILTFPHKEISLDFLFNQLSFDRFLDFLFFMDFPIPNFIQKDFILIFIILFRFEDFSIFQINYFLGLCISKSNFKSRTKSILDFFFRSSFNCCHFEYFCFWSPLICVESSFLGKYKLFDFFCF